MNKSVPLPILIEDMIRKVTDKTQNVENRQHYATTLRNIQEAACKALAQYDKEYKDYFRK